VLFCYLRIFLRFVVLTSSTYLITVGVEVVYFHLVTLRHTPQSVGLLWTRNRPRRRERYLTAQTLYKRQTSMPPVGFEPTIPASAPPQIYALDRAATGIGLVFSLSVNATDSLIRWQQAGALNCHFLTLFLPTCWHACRKENDRSASVLKRKVAITSVNWIGVFWALYLGYLILS
jgi:hypothetical protein